MKRTSILLCMAVILLTACRDHHTPLDVDVWPSLLVFDDQGINSSGEHEMRWIAGEQKLSYNLEVHVLGVVTDHPRTFRLIQTNASTGEVLVVGKVGETWEDIEYVVPANETSFFISIPFLWDEKRMSNAPENSNKWVAIHFTVKSGIGEELHGSQVKFKIFNPAR